MPEEVKDKVTPGSNGEEPKGTPSIIESLNAFRAQDESYSQEKADFIEDAGIGDRHTVLTDAERDDMEDHEFSDAERNKAIQSRDAARDLLGEKQDNWDRFGRALWKGGVKGGLSAVQMLTDVADWHDDSDMNDVSEWLQETKDKIGEYNEIYDNPDDDMVNMGWWMRGLESTIESTIQFAVPGGIAGKGISGLTRMMGARGMIAEGLSRFTTAIAMNQMESNLMAKQMHQDLYNDFLNHGFSTEEADRMAQEKTNDFRIANLAMVVPEFFGLRSITGVPLTGGIKQGFGKQALGFAKESGMEAIEEIYGDGAQFIIGDEAKREYGLSAKSGDSALNRSLKWFKEEGWESGFWGAVGGPFQQGSRSLVQFAMDKATGRADFRDIPEPPAFEETPPTVPKQKLKEIPIPKHKPFTDDNGEAMVSVLEESGEVIYTQEAWEDKVTEIESEFQTENASLIKEWDEYQTNLDEYNDKKKASEDLHRQWSSQNNILGLRKLTGTKGQAVKDVTSFLKEQGSLEKEWQDAVNSDDKIAMDDILSRKMEGMFLRYAEHGQDGDGKGSIERLEQALDMAVEEGADNAVAAREKVKELRGIYEKAYKNAYRTQDASVARAVAREVLLAEHGASSTAKLLDSIDQKLTENNSALVEDAIKLHPGKQINEQARVKAKEVEANALGVALQKTNDPTASKRIKNRIKQLEASIKEEKENLTDTIPEDDFDPDLLDETVKLAEQRANHFAALNAYKATASNMKKADYFKKKASNKEEEFYRILKDTNVPEHLNLMRQMVNADSDLSLFQKQGIKSAISAKYKDAVDFQRELQEKEEQYSKRSEALRKKKNDLNKRIREHYADTLVLEDGKTKSEYDIEALQEKQKEVFDSIKDAADKKEKNKIIKKHKNLKEREASLKARVNQRKSQTLPVSMFEQQLDDVKEEQAELITSSLSPFSDSIKNNSKLKRALHKLVTEQDLTIKELESLLELPGTNDNFKADMERRIAEAKELEKHTKEEGDKNFNTKPGEKVEENKEEEDTGTEEENKLKEVLSQGTIVSKPKEGTVVQTPEGGTVSNTENFKEREPSKNEEQSRDEEVDRYSKYDEREISSPDRVEVEEFLEEEDNEIDKAKKEEEAKKEPKEEVNEEDNGVTDDLIFDQEDRKKEEEDKEGIEEDSTETVDDSKGASEVEPVFVEEETNDPFELLQSNQSKMPTSVNIRKKNGADKNLIGGAVWLSDPKNASDKTKTELKLVVRDGKLYWAPGLEVQDNYYKTKPFREVLLPFTNKRSFDLENGNGSYDKLVENVSVYMDEYTTNIVDMKWNEMSYQPNSFVNPLPNLGIDPNDAKVAISINREWSESGTKEGGNTPASWMEDTWTNSVNDVVLDYKTPDGKQANLPLWRSYISKENADDITKILKEMFNAAKDPKFSMKEFWNREYSDPGNFENVTVQEALDSLVDMNYSTDISYTGPDGNLNVDKTGNSAIYIKYKDGKNKRQPTLYIRNKAGEITGKYTAKDFNDETTILEIASQFSDNFLNPAHRWRINKPININTESATIRGVVMSKGDTWNNFYFKSKTLTTNGQFAQKPLKEGGSHGAHELHGGVKMDLAPIKLKTKKRETVKPLQKEVRDSHKIYTEASNDIAEALARLC